MARTLFGALTISAWACLSAPASAQSAVSLETEIDSALTRVVLRSVGRASAQARVVATIAHRAGDPPIGAVSPDGRTLALATVPAGGEPRRHAQLVLVDLQRGRARTVARDLQQVPPSWSRDGRTVYAVRSYPMPPPSEAQTRHGRLEDERLVLQAVRAADGVAREACTDVAYVLHPIGVAAATGELVVIRVSWQGASIRAIDPGSCATRDLVADRADVLRDAHLDGRAETVVYLRRLARSHYATIERVGVSDGAPVVVARVGDRAMPVPLGEGVAYTSGAALVAGRVRLEAPQGAISAIASSADGALVVHRTTASGHAYSVLAPGALAERALGLAARTTLSIAGFVGGAR